MCLIYIKQNMQYNVYRKDNMGNYNRGNRSGGGRYGGDFRRRPAGPRQMHNAVCDDCGKDCEVPFRPSGDKPIYCSECFEKKGGGSKRPSRSGSGRSGYGKKDDTNKKLIEQMSSLNVKLDRILKVLESGNEKKPVLKKPKEKEVKKPAVKTKKAKAKKTSPKVKKAKSKK